MSIKEKVLAFEDDRTRRANDAVLRKSTDIFNT